MMLLTIYNSYHIIANNTGEIATVSKEDYEYLNAFRWSQNTRGHFLRNDKGAIVMLHREIAKRSGFDLSKMIDHRDRNKLNNQRSNLRAADDSQNQYNSAKQRNNTSGFKGVTWDRNNQRWVARIRFTPAGARPKRLHLGSFVSRAEAAEAYAIAARNLHGEFACTV